MVRKQRKRGAALGLVLISAVTLIIIGVALLFIIQIFSGAKQVANATDAAALAGAQQILTVTLTPSQVKALPQEFAGLGVDSNGNTCPSGYDSNGNPALYNIISYNNCAAYALEIALNAASEGSSTAIQNASTVISALNTFASQLDQNIKNSQNIPTAAQNFMAENSVNNLPGPLLNGSTGSNVLPGSFQFAYYASSDPAANIYFPATFSSQNSQITNWVKKLLSNTQSQNEGPNLIAAGKPFDINQITGNTGFVDSNGKDLVIALVPFQTQYTHLVSPSSNSYFTSSFPNMTNVNLPHNALQLVGEAENSSSSSNNNSPEATGNSGGLNLIALSAAVASNPSQTPAYYPSGNPPNNGGFAYVAIVNGGDYQASMNNDGYTASSLQSQGWGNVNLTSSTSIGYDASQNDIFNVLAWDIQYAQWLVIGTDSQTGLYNIYQQSGTQGWTDQVTNSPQNFPATNYNNVEDNPGLSSTTPSIPFVFLADYNADSTGYITETWWTGTKQQTLNASITDCMNDFGAWIAYNTSQGNDGLGHNPSLDPLQSLGGSPALYKNNPNYVVPNTLISSTSDFMQTMTLADALKIVDICVFHDGQFVFTGNQPAWMNNIMPVIASNYGLDYLPTSVEETKPNGMTAIEYAKAQAICINAGLGLSANPPILPSDPRGIFLDTNACSGLRYFQPYDTSGNMAHYTWPEPTGCPKFETPGSPLQLMKNINILNNSGKFSASDANYNAVLNAILAVVQQMNPNLVMDDVTSALDSAQIDLGQTFYLAYDSTQKKLVMLKNLPSNMTYQPADSTQPSATYSTTYSAGQGNGNNQLQTLIDTTPAPNSTISYNGQNVCPAPYGDSETHQAPYNVCLGMCNNSNINITDTVTFWPSSGANNNHGEIHLFETINSDMIVLEAVN